MLSMVVTLIYIALGNRAVEFFIGEGSAGRQIAQRQCEERNGCARHCGSDSTPASPRKLLKTKNKTTSTCGVRVTGVLVYLNCILKNLRQFGCESALGFVIALPSSATIGPIALFRSRSRSRSRHRACGATLRCGGSLGRLRRVCPKNFIFERGSIETPDNCLHFVRCGCFHEREAFGLLRFVIPDDLNRIRDKVFGGEPLFNVVCRDPNGVNCPERR